MTAPHPSTPDAAAPIRACASGDPGLRTAASGLPGALPGIDGDRPFREPWEAKAFGLVVSLSQAGHFTWAEWVEYFSREVAAATATEAAGGTPSPYYEQWLACAERLLVDKGLVSREQLALRRFSISASGFVHRLR